MKRILVIGTSGSGKTTFAEEISVVLNIPFHASDPFYWGEGWALIPSELVHQKVKAVVNQDEWVLDGNFDSERDLVWERADCIIWLDYPFSLIFFRVLTRNLGWWITRKQVWSSNRMTLAKMISGIRHSIRSYPLKKEKYNRWGGEYSTQKFYRFCNPKESFSWLQNLKC